MRETARAARLAVLAAAAGLLGSGQLDAQVAPRRSISLTMPSVVSVLAVNVRGGELQAMSAGSGTIVASDGTILTNHHVLYDAADQRPYDLFLIGRFRTADRDPDLICAGAPADGELRADLDLALIRCDADLDGKPWEPENWPNVPIGDSQDIVPGEQIWVLGYPNAGGGPIRVSAGLVSGWTGEHGGASGRAFMRTDAAVDAGNSGGAAVDHLGRLVGVPTAFRVVTPTGAGTITSMGRVGLIRPIEAARDLIELARARAAARGAAAAALDAGALVTGTVIDAASGQPISGAFVLALPGQTTARGLDRGGAARLVLAWGSTDATGTFTLEPPLPRGARYSIAVAAAGFLPAVETDALSIPAGGVQRLVPWRRIGLFRVAGSSVGSNSNHGS